MGVEWNCETSRAEATTAPAPRHCRTPHDDPCVPSVTHRAVKAWQNSPATALATRRSSQSGPNPSHRLQIPMYCRPSWACVDRWLSPLLRHSLRKHPDPRLSNHRGHNRRTYPSPSLDQSQSQARSRSRSRSRSRYRYRVRRRPPHPRRLRRRSNGPQVR